MNKLIHYIKLRSGLSGCNAKEFECDKYLDCDSCLEAKIQEHDAKVRADAIKKFVDAYVQSTDTDLDSICKVCTRDDDCSCIKCFYDRWEKQKE